MEQHYPERFAAAGICVLMPTYNNQKTLRRVIEEVLAYTDQLIVVNDGSTDDTAKILKDFPSVQVLTHDPNRGKGEALKTGFDYAIAKQYRYAITIDSDGQHFAKDLPAFLEKIEQEGSQLIVGARNMEQAAVPGKSSFGHKFSNFWYWVETGQKLPDTQSGYRLYPLEVIKGMRLLTWKYELEIEVIVKAAWKGVKVDAVPVSVYYGSERVSHFRPFKDFTRVSILNTFLVTIALLYIHPRNFIRSLFKKDTYRRLRDELTNPNDSDLRKAVSIAFGIFMGIFPIWGFQLMVAIPLALLFRLNKWLVILFANISITPMIPLIVFVSFKVGELWMDGDAVSLIFSGDISIETIKLNVMQYVYGAITLSIVAGLLFGAGSFAFLTLKRKRVLVNG